MTVFWILIVLGILLMSALALLTAREILAEHRREGEAEEE